MNDSATRSHPRIEEADDEALMLSWIGGRADAFEQLFARHRLRLHRFLLRQLHDQALVDDVFQDIWQRLIAARAGCASNPSFQARPQRRRRQ